MGFPLSLRRALAYQAASQTKGAAPTQSTGSALAGHEGDVVRLRANDARRNSPDVANGIRVWKYTIRGPVQPQPDSDAAQAAFDRWSDACGYRHQAGTLAQQVGRAINATLNDGRAWVQRVQVQPSGATSNGLLLLVRGSDEIDRSRGDNGLEFDQGGALSGVWFQTKATARGSFDFKLGVGQSRLFSRLDLIELRMGDALDTDDGEPLAHASLVADKLINELALADVRARQAAANITAIAFTDRAAVSGRPFAGLQAQPSITGPSGEKINLLTPNTMLVAQGVDGIHTPRIDNGAVDFAAHRARIAAGMGHTLQTVGGDTSTASMSSLLHSTQMLHIRAQDMGVDMGVPTMLRTILGWYLAAELLAGRDWYREQWDWLERPPLTINPLRDVEALALEVESGFESEENAIRRRGRDPRTVARERSRGRRQETGELRVA